MGYYDCGDGTAAGDPSGCSGPSTYNPADISSFTGTGNNNSFSTEAQSWITTLGGLFGNIYRAVNPQTSVPPVSGQGIPNSAGSLHPAVQQTGIGTLAVIGGVILLVMFMMKRR